MYRSGQKVYFLFMFLCLENTEILFDYFLSFSFSFRFLASYLAAVGIFEQKTKEFLDI